MSPIRNKRGILYSNALYTFLAIIVGFCAGAFLLAAAGISPAAAYGKLFNGIFGNAKYMTWCVVYASPLIFTGLSVAFSFRTGVFNIGAEGQFVVGSLAACTIGVLVDAPAPLHALLCIAAAAAAGAVCSAAVALMKVKRGINEVLSFIMFNWLAFYLSNYVVNLPAMRRTGGGEATKDIAESAVILAPQSVIRITGCPAANYGIVMAAAAALIIWFIINRTTLGFRLRAVGCNPYAAKYGGINADRAVMTAMSVSGALAGLGGAVQTLGMSWRLSQFAGQEGFGFQGITVALIGASDPVGCIFAGLFYGAMKYGGTKLSLVKAPAEVVDIIMGTIIIFIAVSHVFRNFFTSKFAKEKGRECE